MLTMFQICHLHIHIKGLDILNIIIFKTKPEKFYLSYIQMENSQDIHEYLSHLNYKHY